MPPTQVSTKPKQDSVLFGFLYLFFKYEYLQDKIKDERISEVLNGNIFLLKISLMREVSLLKSMDHSKISAVMVE